MRDSDTVMRYAPYCIDRCPILNRETSHTVMRDVPYLTERFPYCIEGGGGGEGKRGYYLKFLKQNRSKYLVLKKIMPNS